MKTLQILFLLLSMVICAAAQPVFRLPKAQQWKMANGLTVFHYQDDSLPLVAFRLLISGAGNASEPAHQEGLADITAELILKGTQTKSAQQIAASLDFLGASLSVSAGNEYVEMSGRSLDEQFNTLLGLAGESLLHPAFAGTEFDKEKNRRIDQISAIKDNPAASVRYYFYKSYFGVHPMGHLSIGNESSLALLQQNDVQQFYQSRYRPDQAMIAVVGKINRRTLEKWLDQHFSAWKKPAGSKAAPATPPLPVPDRKILRLIDKPDATQAYFMLGAPGLPMGDARAGQAAVMNTLLGGRFTSWLNTELRIKRGLTYGARSNLQSWNIGGLFTVSSYTKNDKIGEMLQISFDLLDKARTQGFSEEEVASARNYILGQFPPRFENLMSKARAFTDLAFYGMAQDYYTSYLGKVALASPHNTQAMAKQLIPQDAFVLIIVGNAVEIRDQLRQFGNFEEKTISEPGFAF